jgi:hypothetical protein
MAANTFFDGTTDDTAVFDRPVNHLLIFVSTGTTFSFSLDRGESFMTLPAGFHSFPIGAVSEVHVQSTGAWQLIGEQA